MDYMELSCGDFVRALSSKEPTPGGGGAAALVGAIGAALGGMVGSLTVGKVKYAGARDDITALNSKAVALQGELMALVARDAEAFEPLSKAYALPRETEAERAERARVMEAALKGACAVPLEIMRKCCEAIDLLRAYADKGAAIAVSDAGCGAVCCKAALQAASFNVFINTKMMADRALAEENNRLAEEMLTIYVARADVIFGDVLARLNARD